MKNKFIRPIEQAKIFLQSKDNFLWELSPISDIEMESLNTYDKNKIWKKSNKENRMLINKQFLPNHILVKKTIKINEDIFYNDYVNSKKYIVKIYEEEQLKEFNKSNDLFLIHIFNPKEVYDPVQDKWIIHNSHKF